MATIKVSDLRPTGFDLFSDSEGYMNELNDSEFDGTYGGLTPGTVVIVSAVTQAAARSTQACAASAVGAVNGVVGIVRWLRD